MKFKALLVLFIVSILSYVLSPSMDYLLKASSFNSFRIQLMYITGSMGIIFMSAAVIISARLSFVNKIFGGLDKAYDVHRITAAVGFFLGVFHLLLKLLNNLLIDLNVLEAPVKSVNKLQGFILELYKACYAYLEPAFYIMIIVVLLAIIKAVPYYYFRVTHKLISVLYLFVAFHAFMAPFRSSWQLTVGGSIMHILIIAGTVCAFISIFNLTGIMHRYTGKVKNKKHFGDNIIQLEIQLQDKDFKFNCGQFVFLKFSYTMEAHPFSVAGWDKNNKVLTFYIKQIGDFTSKLYDKISADDKVVVEGPYGEFTFQDTGKQVWIAGGIGITPFLSKINSLNGNETNNVELIYSYMGKSPFEDILVQQCAEKNVKLHIIDSQKEGLLTFDKIMELSPDIVSSTVWFCGPVMFRKVVEDGMKQNNISLNKLHFDNFSFR